ncbi:MAG: YybH family protein [Deltaproteobacteria bacterium]
MSISATDPECREIFAVTEAETKAIEAGDFDAYMSLLTDDAVFLPQNDSAKSGDELRRWLREFLGRVAIKYAGFNHGETIVRDDLAFHFYTCSWTAVARSGGQPVRTAFKGMHILRRQPDGSWKISRSIWNTDPAPAAS